MPTLTTNFSLPKPNVGGDDDAWGAQLNDGLDIIDTELQALNVASAATDVAVAALAAANGLDLISRTVLAVAASTLNVTWDNADYDTIEIHVQNCIPVTDLAELRIRTDNAGGASFDTGASDYGYRYVTRQLGATESSTTNGATTSFIKVTNDVGNDVPDGGVSVKITLHNAGLADRQTTLSWTGIFNTGVAATKAMTDGAGTRNIAQIVNALRLYFSTGNIQAGAIVTVYGYRK